MSSLTFGLLVADLLLAAGQASDNKVDIHGDALPAGALARFGTVRFRHGGPVLCACFSPDGKLLASGGRDNAIRLWNPRTGEEVGALQGHENWPLALAFAPDGKTLISGGRDNTVRVWDVTGRKELRKMEGGKSEQGATLVALSPDGAFAAAASPAGGVKDSLVRVWDIASGKEVHRLAAGRSFFVALMFAPDGTALAAGSMDQSVMLWDMPSGKLLSRFERHKSANFLAFSPAGKLLVSEMVNDGYEHTELATGKKVSKVQGSGIAGRGVAFTRDGSIAGGPGAHSRLRLWDVASGKPLREIPVGLPQTLCFSPDGKLVALAGLTSHAVHVWEVESGREIVPTPGHISRITGLALSADGKLLTTASGDGTLRIWNVGTGKQLRVLDANGPVRGIALAPDGKTLATVGNDPVVRLWSIPDGKKITQLKGHKYSVTCVAFSADGKYLVTGSSDKTVRLWDLKEGTLSWQSEHDHYVLDVAFAPDGKSVASAGTDRAVRLWNIDNGRELHELRGHNLEVTSLAFAPDGKMLASGSGNPLMRGKNTICLWNPTKGTLLRKLEGHPNQVSALAFSADGQWLASGNGSSNIQMTGNPAYEHNGDFSIRVWDVTEDKVARAAVGHRGWITQVRFASQDRLLSGSWDTSVLLWDVKALPPVKAKSAHPKLEKPPPSADPTLPPGVRWRRRHEGGLGCVAFAPDGLTLAAASDRNGTIYLWSADGASVGKLLGHVKDVHCVAFSPDGKKLASAGGFGEVGGDHTVRVWDVASGKNLIKIKQDTWPKSVAFSADGKMLASAPPVRAWSPETGELLLRIDAPDKKPAHPIIAVSGMTLASVGSDSIVLTSLASERPLRELKPVRGYVTCLAFSPDGSALVAAEEFGALNLWETATGNRLLQFPSGAPGAGPSPRYAAFSGDGRILATAGGLGADKLVRLWEVATGRQILQLESHRPLGATAVAFSPTEPLLASVDGGGMLVLWYIWDAKLWNIPKDANAAKKIDQLWEDLLSADAAVAYRAMAILSRDPAAALPFLKARLKPVPKDRDRERVRRCIARLDDTDLAVWGAAADELVKLGPVAFVPLRQALAATSSPETRARIEALLANAPKMDKVPFPGELDGESLRAIRAIQVLERIGTANGRGILRELTRSGIDAPETQFARAALRRLLLRGDE